MPRKAWNDWPPPSRPRRVVGGIKAHSKRGRFAETWWAARWIAVLEGFDVGARLGRGRSYARSGQVLRVDIDKGLVRAAVQGSRPKPYEVAIEVQPLGTPAWDAVLDALHAQPLFAARLLAGDMPHDIEQVFAAAGASLFPDSERALTTSCSCPDWSNPCKHIAAVYYLLGEEFDRDPFLLFRLRGLTREELVARLTARTASTAGPPAALAATGVPAAAASSPSPPATALSDDPARFWREPVVAPDFHGAVARPAAPDALLQRLGRFPFWRGERTVTDALPPVYAAASERALALFLGEG